MMMLGVVGIVVAVVVMVRCGDLSGGGDGSGGKEEVYDSDGSSCVGSGGG